jgi:hypothetical protein
MADCIYCGASADSKEDWLPRGFGRIKNITLLKDRLCRACNTGLGRQVDVELLRTGPTGLLKAVLKIEGRHGTPPPDPFLYRVMGPEAASMMMMQPESVDHQVLGSFYVADDGRAYVTPLRQLVFRKTDGSLVCVQFPSGYDAILLKRLIGERGLTDATLVEMWLEKHESHEDESILKLVREAVGPFKEVEVFGGQGSIGPRQNVLSSANISVAYIRGIAKVAFHYYLWTSEIHTGSELLFQPIRRFIQYGEGDWRNFVMLMAPPFIGELAQGYAPEHFSHFFMASKEHGYVISRVQFFVGPDHVTPPALVLLGLTQRNFESRCHWVGYYGEKVDDYDGEIIEVKSRRALAQA